MMAEYDNHANPLTDALGLQNACKSSEASLHASVAAAFARKHQKHGSTLSVKQAPSCYAVNG